MRSEERYALEVLVEKYGGEIIEGDDPPDGYIIKNTKKYAVEVSRLIQNVTDDNGVAKPRIADDTPAHLLINDIDLELRDKIPTGKYVFVILYTPINNIRKTKRQLISKILEMIEIGREEDETEICTNLVSISIYAGERESGKKVIAAFPNSRSSADIGANVDYLLLNRIRDKENKRKELPNVEGYWLALINEYWIANEQSYQVSYDSLGIEHGFDKVLLINYRKQSHEIYSKKKQPTCSGGCWRRSGCRKIPASHAIADVLR